MEVPAVELTEFFRDRELGHLLQPVRVTLRKSLPTLNVGLYTLAESTEGDSREVPRWAADVLVGLGFADLQEEPFEVDLYKALSRERIQGPLLLASLRADFYLRLRRFLLELRKRGEEDVAVRQEYDKLAVAAYDLLTLRTGKVVYLASAAGSPTDLAEKTTPEERQLFEEVHTTVTRWRRKVLAESA